MPAFASMERRGSEQSKTSFDVDRLAGLGVENERFFQSLAATIVNGAAVLAPLFLVGLTFVKLSQLLIKLGTPAAELCFKKGTFDHPHMYVPFGLVLILVCSLLTGLALRLPAVQSTGRWVRQKALCHLPGYELFRRISLAFAGQTEQDYFKPALLLGEGGVKRIAFVIEDHGDGNLTVMLPNAPTPFAGSIHIVPKTQIQILDVHLGRYIHAITHWGVGMGELIQHDGAATAPK
jgi:uncharacterized membrane protein